MKEIVRSTLVVVLLLVCWIAVAQTEAGSPATPNPLSSSDPSRPLIAVSTSVLDFGLVGVGRSKNLTLEVRNLGGGTIKGTVMAAAPFSVDRDNYSLKSGKGESLRLQYTPTAEGTNSETVVLSDGSGTIVNVNVTGYARTPPPPPGGLRLRKVTKEEDAAANFIVQYSDDQTSYVLRPSWYDGDAQGTRGPVSFLRICSRADVLKKAAEQPRRDLAFVLLFYYPGGDPIEEPVKQEWVRDFKALGYHRLFFLRQRRKIPPFAGLEIVQEVMLFDSFGSR